MDIRHREAINKRKEKNQNARDWSKNVRSLLTLFEHQQLKSKKKREKEKGQIGNFRFHKYAPSMKAAAWRGNPLGSNTPTSVVVPPISTTIMLFPDPSLLFRSIPAKYDAPLIEFVAPEEKVLIGRRAASSAEVSVPSFWSN